MNENSSTMTYIRGILLVASLWAGYRGYNKLPLIPDGLSTPSVTVVDETFPKVEMTPDELMIMSRLPKTIEKGDALLLARGCRDWNEQIRLDTKITNLGQFSVIQANLFKSFLENKTKGKYGGTISPVLEALYRYEFRSLVTESGVTSTAIGPNERALLVRYFAILSQSFAQIAGVA